MSDKWIPVPAPSVDLDLQKELTELGGLIPQGCGHLSGKPLFELVWAPDVMVWQHGKMRKRFLARQRRERRHYELTNEAAEWLKAWKTARKLEGDRAYLDLKLSDAFLIGEATPALKAALTEHLDYRTLDPGRPRELVDSRFPIYFRDLDHLHQIGTPCFKVLRWMPSPKLRDKVCPQYPTMIDTEQQWSALRYDMAYFPEIGLDMMLDVLGSYPAYGAYEHVFVSLEIGEAPTFNNILRPLLSYLQLRDQVTEKWRTDKDLRMNVTIDEMLAEYERETLQWSNEFDDRMKDARPAFHDTHVVVPEMPSTGGPKIQVVRG